MCILNTTASQILSPFSTLLKTLPKPRRFTFFLYSHLILRNYFSSSDISKSYFPEEINLLGLVSLNSLFSLDPQFGREDCYSRISLQRERRGEAVDRDGEMIFLSHWDKSRKMVSIGWEVFPIT